MTLTVLDNRQASSLHGPQPEGFEHHGRLEVALRSVEAVLGEKLPPRPPTPAPYSLLELAHTKAYLESVRAAVIASDPTRGTPFGEEVLLYPGSLEAARTSAGAALTGVKLLMEGQASHVLSLCRSPGHHAEPEKAMGFCIFSNAAIAARFVSQQFGKRAAVIDIDIHNGNGTFAGTSDDPNCYLGELYLAGDLRNSYPYPADYTVYERTDRSHRIGLPSGTSGETWVQAFREGILPSIKDFDPDLLIVSAGFDCMEGDPVGGFGVTAEDIAVVTRALTQTIKKPILSLLEGGYSLENIERGIAAHARELAQTT